jgi:protein-S-isoprenylcysteine O-methyltransferase Ste14
LRKRKIYMFNKGKLLVAIQFSCLILLVILGHVWPQFIAAQILLILGLLLGIWAILSMKFKVNVFPELLPNSKLITSGPYKFIRHPMYTAVLLVAAAWAATNFTALTAALWVVLLIDLLYKLTYEEKLLRTTFTDYKQYQKRTKRLLPFIY